MPLASDIIIIVAAHNTKENAFTSTFRLSFLAEDDYYYTAFIAFRAALSTSRRAFTECNRARCWRAFSRHYFFIQSIFSAFLLSYRYAESKCHICLLYCLIVCTATGIKYFARATSRRCGRHDIITDLLTSRASPQPRDYAIIYMAPFTHLVFGHKAFLNMLSMQWLFEDIFHFPWATRGHTSMYDMPRQRAENAKLHFFNGFIIF